MARTQDAAWTPEDRRADAGHCVDEEHCVGARKSARGRRKNRVCARSPVVSRPTGRVSPAGHREWRHDCATWQRPEHAGPRAGTSPSKCADGPHRLAALRWSRRGTAPSPQPWWERVCQIGRSSLSMAGQTHSLPSPRQACNPQKIGRLGSMAHGVTGGWGRWHAVSRVGEVDGPRRHGRGGRWHETLTGGRGRWPAASRTGSVDGTRRQGEGAVTGDCDHGGKWHRDAACRPDDPISLTRHFAPRRPVSRPNPAKRKRV